MGDTNSNLRLRLHDHSNGQHHLSRFHFIVSVINAVINDQIKALEAQGIWILAIAFGILVYIYALFVHFGTWESVADLAKNILLSLIGITVSLMGAINLAIKTIQNVRKFRKGKDIDNAEEEKKAS